MKYFSILAFRRTILAVVALVLCSQFALAGGDEIEWRPVSPAELEMKTSTVEPGADAEAIFWDVTIDDKKSTKLEYHHYVRIKILTERGREKYAKMDIPYMKGLKIDGVAARVIKPDGTIVNLQPSDIFDREIVKVNKVKVQAKSFAVPGIEPGVIVEYQYSESYKGDSAAGERLWLQRDIPMQKVTYRLRPVKGWNLKVTPFNIPADMGLTFVDDPDNKGFKVASMTSVPAIKEEPYMPPPDETRRWAYLSYSLAFTWLYTSMRNGMSFQTITKTTKNIQRQADQLVAGASTPDEKLQKIYDFVQTGIKNVTFDPALTDEQRGKVANKDADEVLENRMGHAFHIDVLFAALAQAAGFETALFMTGDRTENFFSPEKYPPGFMEARGIAVVVDKSWKFFNPGSPFLPYGKIQWYEEGMQSMLVKAGGFVWKTVPITNEMTSSVRRVGKFKLLEDGTLEGKVSMEFNGHQATRRRREGYMSSAQKRDETILDEAKANTASAEVSGIMIGNFDAPAKPLAYSYNVTVPNYAQRTGKRIILQPGFFEYGSSPAFSSSTRVNSVYFSYPWSEYDYVEIELPKGFELDSAEAPGDVFEPSKVGGLQIMMALDKTTGILKYKRSFYFGSNGRVLFPVETYASLKQLFDAFHKADKHVITLKQVQ